MMTKTKITVPDAKLLLSLEAGSTSEAVKDAGATTGKVYNVPIGKIKTIPGYNVRVDSEDYREHRDTLVDLIRQNGFNPAKPLTGYVAKEGDDNVIYITDGHTRLDAVHVFNDDVDTVESERILALPVVIREDVPSMADLTVELHTSNSGRPLTPFELGVVVKRLLAEGELDKQTIANRLAVTPRYIDDVLLLADAPAKVRSHVLKGEVSSTMAIQELRRNPNAASDRIETAVAKAKQKGKKRATAKDVGPKVKSTSNTLGFKSGDDMKAILKNVAAQIREMIPNAADALDDSEDAVKVALAAGTIKLVVGVEQAADEKPAAKKAPAKSQPAAKKAPAKDKAAPPEEATPPEEGEPLDMPTPPAVASETGGNDDDI